MQMPIFVSNLRLWEGRGTKIGWNLKLPQLGGRGRYDGTV